MGTFIKKAFAYSYDGNGMRYEKEVDGTTTSYYYNGTQLLMESRDGERAWYIYGVTGIEGMILEESYGESVYYFDKNTLGDVIAIRDETGSIVATYKYDAWGNVTVMDEYGNEDTDEFFIGNINPIRYRGYYYDVETGFYYLQSRYYDPSICRFINADDYEIVSYLAQIPGQLNLYAYCNNNPVMYTDASGYVLVIDDVLIWGAVFIAILIGASYIESQTHFIENTANFVVDVVYDGIESLYDSALYAKNKKKKKKDKTKDKNESELLPGAEHTSQANPSKRERHEYGQAAKKRGQRGGEKGDARRPYTPPRKKFHLIFFWIDINNRFYKEEW